MSENLCFYDFFVSESNRVATELCFNTVNGPTEEGKILFISGDSGCGKTHLLNAAYRMFQEHNPDGKAVMVTLEQLVEDYILIIDSSDVKLFWEKYSDINLLMVDDVGFLIGKNATQEELADIFKRMADSGTKVILCSEYGRERFEAFEKYLFNYPKCTVARMEKADAQLRAYVLDKILADENITLSSDIRDYIINGSDKELSGIRAYVLRLGLSEILYGTVQDGKAVNLTRVYYDETL